MKTEFDLNNLTELDVEILEEALSRRRLMKLFVAEIDKDHVKRGLTAAMSAGFRPDEINMLTAFNPRGDSARGTMMSNYRQLGKNPENDLWRASELIKPYIENLKWDYRELAEDQIDEEHEQYNAVFNQFRRSKYLPSIELKIGNLYELSLGKNEVHTKEMYLVRIDGNIKHSPELYFSENTESSKGTNISVYKIIKESK